MIVSNGADVTFFMKSHRLFNLQLTEKAYSSGTFRKISLIIYMIFFAIVWGVLLQLIVVL